MKSINVVAAIIYDAQTKKVFMSQRTDKSNFGKWEFPGGKIESGESPKAALKRELMEEIGINVEPEDMSAFYSKQHNYHDKSVDLSFFLITQYQGQPEGKEGQAIQWFGSDQLNELDVLAANKEIVELIQQKIFIVS